MAEVATAPFERPFIPLRMLQTGRSAAAVEVLANRVTGRRIYIPDVAIKNLDAAKTNRAVPAGAMRWVDFDCAYWLIEKEQLLTFVRQDEFQDEGEPGPGVP